MLHWRSRVFSTQSDEERLAVGGGQPLFTLRLPMFALSLEYVLSLSWGPSNNIDSFTYGNTIIWGTQTKSLKLRVGLKLELGVKDIYRLSWKRLSYEVLFSCTFDVLSGVTYSNMLVATEWPLKLIGTICVTWCNCTKVSASTSKVSQHDELGPLLMIIVFTDIGPWLITSIALLRWNYSPYFNFNGG